MIQTKNYLINSCDDAELGIKRSSKLEFFLTYDDEKDIKAIVCIIAGLGGDANDNYKNHLAKSIAQELPVAVLSVNYFFVKSSTELGATKYIDDIDKLIFIAMCNKIGFKLDNDFIQKANNMDYFNKILGKLNLHMGILKLNNQITMDSRLNIHLSLIAPNGDYQNFGIMSATDIINAILYIKKDLPFNVGGGYLPCFLVGSSHGGYIANMCAKIAPWLIDAVIDNSSWNLPVSIYDNKDYNNPLFKMLGFGKDIDFTKYYRAKNCTENFNLLVSDFTHWRFDNFTPNYFSRSRYQIRDINNITHLKLQSKMKKSFYIGYHSIKDELALANQKVDFYNKLKNLEFQANLHIISGEKEIDEKFIKNLEHGMGMSIKTLILKEVPGILDISFSEFCGKKEVSYPTDEWIYIFKEIDNKLVLNCQKI